jgi:hypothetical protein
VSAAELKEERDNVYRELKKRGRVKKQTQCEEAFQTKLWEWRRQAVYLYHSEDIDSHQVVLLHVGITQHDVDGQQLRQIRHDAVQRLSDVLGR